MKDEIVTKYRNFIPISQDKVIVPAVFLIVQFKLGGVL